jgi:hypothetical protein
MYKYGLLSNVAYSTVHISYLMHAVLLLSLYVRCTGPDALHVQVGLAE